MNGKQAKRIRRLWKRLLSTVQTSMWQDSPRRHKRSILRNGMIVMEMPDHTLLLMPRIALRNLNPARHV